ncbi:MAG: SpoIID/LytB domain-containing protein [Spirochaetes bacterium]|nr:SpoIID/LytB domain-containing protein [Spirochaetota bacterium]
MLWRLIVKHRFFYSQFYIGFFVAFCIVLPYISITGYGQSVPYSGNLFPATNQSSTSQSIGVSLLRSAIDAYYKGRMEESIEILKHAFSVMDPALSAELFRLYQEIGPLGPSTNHVYLSTLKRIGSFLLHTYIDDARLKRELFIAAVLAGDPITAKSFLPLSEPSAESYLFEGLLALEEGSIEDSISRFRAAISLEDNRPAPWYFLGKALVALGRMAEGEAAFRSALRKDGSFLPALIAQSETVLAQGKIQEGYALLSRLVQILPRQKEFRDRLSLLQEQHPELVAKVSEATRQKLLQKVPARILPFSGEISKVPTIRVSLAQHLSSLSFKISSPYIAKWINPDGEEEQVILSPGIYRLFLKEPQEPSDPEIRPLVLPATLSLSSVKPASMNSSNVEPIPTATNLAIEKRSLGGGPFSPKSETAFTGVLLIPIEASSTVLLFDLVTEAGSFIASISDRSYRGAFQVVPSEESFQLINFVSLEEYLYSVLPSEIPASWPMEALKAQAIAARSYSLAMMAQSKDKPFDVYGSTRSASYRGVESEHPRTTQATDDTRGIYLCTAQGPLVAYYHANNGGYGEGTEAVWGYSDTLPPVPDLLTAERTEYVSLVQLTDWLRGTPPAFASMPGFHFPEAYRWERWVTPEEILSRLGREAPPGRITAILTRGRGISGRVKEIEIRTEGGSIRLRGDRVRIVLGGLRSTLFTLRVKVGKDGYPEYFIFNGGGWGHGVGLDQSGAAGMASIGYTAEEILKHYYPNSQFVNYFSNSLTR